MYLNLLTLRITTTAIKLSRVGVQTFRFGRDWSR